jgi:hypothetical protein
MIECDICLDRKAVREAIFETDKGGMLILSLCNDQECNSQKEFTRISNWILLDKGHEESVE